MEESPRRRRDPEVTEAESAAQHARNLELAKKFAEQDKDYVPSDRSRQIIEMLEKGAEEQKKRPVNPHLRPEKYDFAPGIAPDGTPYPVHERPRQLSGEDAAKPEDDCSGS